MNKILVGKTTMTHGLKGDLKFFPSIYEIDKIMVANFPIYIDNEKHILTSSKVYKNCYLIKIDNLNDINLVENFRNKNIYVDIDDIELNNNEYLVSELKGFLIIENDIKIGIVKDILYNKAGILLNVSGQKNFYIPLNDYYIKEVNLASREIISEHAKELML